MRSTYKILVGKPEKRDHLGDLGIDKILLLKFMEIRWEGADWFHLHQWRSLVNKVVNLQVP
jgi:hypothetical protein